MDGHHENVSGVEAGNPSARVRVVPRARQRKLRRPHGMLACAMTVGGLVVFGLPALERSLRDTGPRIDSYVIATLKNLASSQSQHQAQTTRNGAGSYGDFHQLVKERYVSRRFGTGTPTRVRFRGYIYELHLPADPSERGLKWHCYAWPESYGRTGKRVFFACQRGCILASRNANRQYSGDSYAPASDAAFGPPEPGSTEPQLAMNKVGNDGEHWVLV